MMEQRMDGAHPGLHRVVEAIRSRPSEAWTLESMAKVAFLSPFYFNRLFRKTFGISPGRFVTSLRLSFARRLLLTSEMSVTDIAMESGYSSLGTFSRRFTETVGVCPTELQEFARNRSSRIGTEPKYEAAAGATISGRLLGGPRQSERVVFIGLFDTPIPQGMPQACSLSDGEARYELQGVQPGRHYLVAAAMDGWEQVHQVCEGQSIPWVAGSLHDSIEIEFDTQAIDGLDLIFRAHRPEDPPILTFLPMLLQQETEAEPQVAVR